VRALPEPFVAGVNLPWLDYGCDFGANAWQPQGGLARPERRARLRSVLARLAEANVRYLRWFWLCDGRSGVRGGEGREPPGLDEHVVADLEASLELLAERGLRVMPVLLSFDWFGRRQTVRGVGLRGRGALASTPDRRARLVERVFAPLLERFGRADAVFAWDLMNEPEWSTRGAGGRWPRPALAFEAMRSLLGELARCARDLARQPVTVGLASLRGLPLVRGLGLDFYQVHWYDSVGRACSPSRPVDRLGLDAPVVLGEFPSRGSAFTAQGLLEAARQAGYAGGLAWSVLADDPFSDGRACAAAAGGGTRTGRPLLA
jgi:hypothetical protein